MTDQIQQLHARIADLESQLYAIGAGGVGRMMAEPQQDDAPLHCDVCGVECANPWHFSTETERHKHACDACWPGNETDAPKPPAQSACTCTKAPAPAQSCLKQEPDHLRGITKVVPDRQPLPADTYTALAHRIATKYTHRSDPAFCGYAFLPNTLEQFVRAIEQAHGISGGQQ